jgi:hypothetical protein
VSAICPSCGASLSDRAGACAACGTPAPARGNTAVEPLPPDETGPGPVHFDVATARWFGVPPAALMLGLAVVALLAALALFATGRWPVALIMVGVMLLLLAGFGEAARRKPDAAIAQRSLDAFRTARERAGVAVETVAARTRAGHELARVRHELLAIQQTRGAKVTELGEAALAGDAKAMTGLKKEIGGLDRLTAEKEAEMEAITMRAREGIEHARMSVQQTQMLEPVQPPSEPEQYPPDEPAPYPPPDEGNPPEPARVPEPYPPPEITPAQPADDRHPG